MVNRHWDKNNNWTEGVIRRYEHWTLEVSYRQHTLGCVLIFCNRKNVEYIKQIKSEEFKEFKEIMGMAESALNKIFEPDKYNYLQLGNNWRQLHFHCLPRYKANKKFKGKIFEDKNFGGPPLFVPNFESEEFVVEMKKIIKERL